MRITIVGCGSIGSKLAKAADEMAEVKRIYLMDEDHPRAEKLAEALNKAIVINDVEEELYHTDLVIEAASQKAATAIVPKVVARGVDIMIMSVGALVDDEFRGMVKEKAIQSEAKIFIPSGAVCGTDGLRSSAVGELDEVELITTKGPKSLEGVDWIEDHGIDVDTLTEPTRNPLPCSRAPPGTRSSCSPRTSTSQPPYPSWGWASTRRRSRSSWTRPYTATPTSSGSGASSGR